MDGTPLEAALGSGRTAQHHPGNRDDAARRAGGTVPGDRAGRRSARRARSPIGGAAAMRRSDSSGALTFPINKNAVDQFLRGLHRRLRVAAARRVLLGDRRQGLARLDEAARDPRRECHHVVRRVGPAGEDAGADSCRRPPTAVRSRSAAGPTCTGSCRSPHRRTRRCCMRSRTSSSCSRCSRGCTDAASSSACDDSRLKLSRPVWLLGWVSFFTDTASEMVYPLLPLFLTRVLGAGAMSLGVIEGIADAANSVLKIISGRLADRDRPAEAAGAPRLRHLVSRPPADRDRRVVDARARRSASPTGSAKGSAARRATRCSPTSRRTGSAAASTASIAPWTTPAPSSARCSRRLFLYFYPGEYRTLFALTIIPGLIVIAFILAVPETEARPPRTATRPVPAPAIGADACAVSAGERSVVIFLFALGNASDAFLLLRLSDLGIADFWIPLLWSGAPRRQGRVIARSAGNCRTASAGARSSASAGCSMPASMPPLRSSSQRRG